MKKTIYILAALTLIFSCKKESSNPTTNTTTNPTTSIAKYGNGVTDIEGNNYKTVIIGTQEWMAENLKVSKYNDGTAIPNTNDYNSTLGAWCNYGNSDSLGKIYGKLYYWYVTNPSTNGNKNVCPTGWNVPNDSEWKILTDYLGGDSIAGGKMKDIGVKLWESPNKEATNTSLFSGLPGGHYATHGMNGPFYDEGSHGRWWSSSESNSDWAWGISLNNENGRVNRTLSHKDSGLSIRCIKD